ncbi:MAG: hypothetical protein RBS99_04390 [Rhodospirillales bacterium]|jgi:hypothetical protein|nr:hypothetical protein [Rhodospirillales bacterium]
MKGKLLSGVAAVAFGLGMVATGPALAGGSETDWDWYKNKYQEVDINTWIWSFFDPTGVTEVKKTQVYIGDVKAYANLQGDYVPQQLVVLPGTAEVEFEGSAEFDLDYSHHPGHPFAGDAETLSGDLDAASVSGGLNEEWNNLEFTVDVSGTVEVPVEGYIQDLAQYANDGLGHAVQDVSAIGIADSIDSEFPVYAYENQVLTGGLFEKSNIEAMAVAGVWFNPVEIALSQDVSAVAEALSINLETTEAPQLIQTVNADFWDSSVDTGDTIVTGSYHDPAYGVFMPYISNNILEADISQFALADVSASATAFQDLSAFKQLGHYDRLGEMGLVASQNVQAAGLVASITNKVKEVTP